MLICKRNPENQWAMFKFMPIFQQHIGKGEYVLESLIDVFQVNSEILQELAKNKENDFKLLKEVLLKDNKTHDIIKFFSMACSCEEQAIYANQEIIFKTIVEDRKKHDQIFMRFEKKEDNDIPLLIYKDQDDEEQKTDMVHFFEQEGNPLFAQQYEFLKAQLQMYAMVCLNRNFSAIKKIQSLFSLKAIKSLAYHPKIPEDIKALFYLLIRTVHLDMEPYQVQMKPSLVRVACAKKKDMEYKPKVTSTEFIIYGESHKKMYLYMDENDKDLYDFNEENEIPIEEFKGELLTYLQSKADYLLMFGTPLKVYNELTLEIIKILKILLKFGLLQ